MNYQIIKHPHFKKTVESLQTFLENGFAINGQARCAVLTGPPRSGKTTAAEKIVAYVESRPLPARKGDPGASRRRTLYVETPAAATQKSIAETILIAANDPFRHRMSQAQLLNRVCGVLRDLDVELLVIDEFHHLLTTGKKASAVEVAEFVKTILNAGICPILLIGIEPVSDIITQNGQLEGRCWCRPALRLFGFSTQAERASFAKLLGVMGKSFSIPSAFDFSDMKFAECMHLATDGAIGLIALLCEKAVAFCTLNNSMSITMDSFVAAYSDWEGAPIGGESRQRNPFLER
jgi:Bacterial TniB protein